MTHDKKITYQGIASLRPQLNIGLFGFGCVGQGLYDVLNNSQGLKAEISKICVKDRTKSRKIDKSFFTFEKKDILKNGNHDLIVELIDDAQAAYEITGEAINKGKSVVTANKKMVAENFEALFRLQVKSGSSFLYEGACGGSIPIIRTLEEYYDNELLGSVKGILNGSSNYILTKMETDKLGFEDALKEAQALGFAESDPFLDIAGYDTKYKLCILSVHAFGLILKPQDILNIGIQNISQFDINYANEKGYRIKLIANARKVNDKYQIYVLPVFIPKGSPLSTINNEFNGIEVEGVYSDKQFFVGKGAGSHPTGSAVLSDISAITYDYKYGYKKLKKRINGHIPDFSKDKKYLDDDFIVKLYIRYVNGKDLLNLEIANVVEQYSSSKYNYVIANVIFSSLKKIKQTNRLFVCELEQF
ncbi:MAG TPA: homoserine dehydrogenase [Ignavibacteria bacterium]